MAHSISEEGPLFDPTHFCTHVVGTCQHGEVVDVSSFSAAYHLEEEASNDQHRHVVIHKGLAVDNSDYRITDEAIEVVTEGGPQSLWDQFVHFIRGDPSAQDLFYLYQAELELRVQEQLEEEFLLKGSSDEGKSPLFFVPFTNNTSRHGPCCCTRV